MTQVKGEQHPDHVRWLVVISSPHARSALYPETQQGMSQVGAAMAENMVQTPTGKFSKQWSEPQRFPQFLDKMGKMMSEDYDWSVDIAKLPIPVLLVFADHRGGQHRRGRSARRRYAVRSRKGSDRDSVDFSNQ